MIGSTSHKEQVEYNRGNTSTNRKKKQNYTKRSFKVQVVGLIWLLVVVALLDGVAALGCNELLLLKFKA